MATRPDTSLDGALYELVARGRKDEYFFKDDEKSENPFDYRYERFPAILPEVRYIVPLNAPNWGSPVEFEYDFYGDLLMETKLVIELPTWLPNPEAFQNYKSVIQDLSGVRYGYTNGIAYFLVKKMQIYQDNFLLQEVSGDALYALSRTRGALNGARLNDKVSGVHSGTPLDIQRNATPGPLNLDIPLPGCQLGDTGDFPVCALREQTFRVKIWLRRLEELVEASDGQPYPQPWSKTMEIQTQKNGPFTQFQTLSREQIKAPTLLLMTRQNYVTNELREKILKTHMIIPFRRYFENIFSFNDRDFAPLDRGAAALSNRRLDGQFLVERIVHFFRNQTVFQNNRLIDFSNGLPGQEFYNEMKLVIAGQDREFFWGPKVWKDVVQHAKEEKYTLESVATMNWGYGWRYEDGAPAERQPQGGINFTTADRPQINLSLVDIPPISVEQGRSSEMRSILESWAVYEIKGARGRFKYAN